MGNIFFDVDQLAHLSRTEQAQRLEQAERARQVFFARALADMAPETRVQFERTGYFVADRYDHQPGAPVFNRIVALRDTWAKMEQG